RYLRKLERDGWLDRELEFLPSEKALADRRQHKLGLTGPEFAVLLAYTKLTVDSELLASDLPDDPHLESWLVSYFPSALRERFRAEMREHPLRRGIISTCVTNALVSHSGTTFVFRLAEETGASVPDIARAYLVAREVFDMASFWDAVERLDGKVAKIGRASCRERGEMSVGAGSLKKRGDERQSQPTREARVPAAGAKRPE